MENSILTKNQKKTFTKTNLNYNGQKIRKMEVTVRYDDECGNNHNTFAITATIWFKGDREINPSMGGCCHDEIARFFPELKHLIKWHHMNADKPMHYIANTLFHAQDRTHPEVEIGDPVRWRDYLGFKNTPFVYRKFSDNFISWLLEQDQETLHNKEIIAVSGKISGGDSIYTNYTLKGFKCNTWHDAPFSTESKAREFLFLAEKYPLKMIKTPIAFCEPQDTNIEHARACAIAPDATLEQLRDKDWLNARLPALVAEFRETVESELLGFTY